MFNSINVSVFPKGIYRWLIVSYWIVGIYLLMITKQGDVVLFVNSLSFPKLDKLVVFFDFFGHGMFALIAVAFFLLYRLGYGLQLWLSFGFVTLFSHLLKRIVFLQHNRPLWHLYFDDLDRYISLAPINYLRSFPSGHSMTAFALATVLAFWVKSTFWQSVLFLYALTVSIGRIYLCQHFFVDTLWGAMLGVLSAMLSKIVIDKFLEKDKNGYLNMPVLQFFSKLKK